MRQYHNMLIHVLENGQERTDRTGTGTIGVFGYQNRYNLADGFPLITTKFVPLRVIFEELKWFLMGDTDIKYLMEKNVKIWLADAYRDYRSKGGYLNFDAFEELVVMQGYNLGPIYGKQWRSWSHLTKTVYPGFGLGVKDEPIDQLRDVVTGIKHDPFGRRHLVSAWNVEDLKAMALPPCHVLFQYYVSNDRKLSCQLYQRSADAFLGVPFNIASYAMKTHMIARFLGLEVGEFIHTFGDLHIYKDHLPQVEEQLNRKPHPLPTLIISDRKVNDISEYVWEDIKLENYVSDPVIKGKVSVGN